MKQEKAIFVENISALMQSNLSDYDRLYFGQETCERLLPSLPELNQAKQLAEKNSLQFSLVTPFCTNEGLKRLLPLLKILSSEDELIVNDLGVLQAASKSSNAQLVAGRLLNKQYRDPKIASFKSAPPEITQHLRSSHASSPLFQQLMEKFNVKRVELDNLLQGIETNLSSTNLRASLYYPFVFISATRFCLTANCDRLLHAKKIGIFPCGRECLKYSFKLESKEFNKPLYLFGNALYFENKKFPKDLEKKGIDRVVFIAKTLL